MSEEQDEEILKNYIVSKIDSGDKLFLFRGNRRK